MDSANTLLPAATYVVYLIVFYCLGLGCYRLFLHPLSHYPGPLAARLCDIYGAFYAAHANLHIKTWDDHLKYGPVIRQGPNKLVFNTVAAVHDIYQNERITKSRAYLVTQRGPDVYSLWNSISPDLHRTKRKLVGQVVNDRSMRMFEPIMIEQVDVFIQELLKSCRGEGPVPVDMTQRCKRLGMDIVGHLSFAYPLNLQTDPTYRFMPDSTAAANYFLNINMQQPFFAKFHAELFLYLRAVMRGKSYLRTVEKMIKTRLANSQHARHDFYSVMADNMRISEKDNLWTSEIWGEAIFFLTAGGDTTSTGLSALFFYLSRNPHCYQRLAEEIRSTFTSGADIRSPMLAKCQYLRACFDEALRMSPPIPGTLWREEAFEYKQAAEPLLVDGHVIPPGTQVGVNAYAIHHNEEYFPEPFEFKPERWLPDSPESRRTNKNAFVPFSVGARGCAGKAMAYLEAGLVIAKALWYFDFEKAPREVGRIGGAEGRSDEYHLRDIVVSVHDGPYLTFRLRNDSVKELAGKIPGNDRHAEDIMS